MKETREGQDEKGKADKKKDLALYARPPVAKMTIVVFCGETRRSRFGLAIREYEAERH